MSRRQHSVAATLALGSLCAVLWLAAEVYGADKTYYVNAVKGRDCSSCGTKSKPFKTIQAAVNKGLAATLQPFIINVAAGAYSENVSITRGWVTIIGAGAATTSVVAKDAALDTIYIQGANQVYVGGLTISGGASGVNVISTPWFLCENCIIENNGRGVYGRALSTMTFWGVTCRSNGPNGGMWLGRGTMGIIEKNCDISGNTGDGAMFAYTSNGRVRNSKFNNNSGNGLFIFTGASADLQGVTIDGNSLSGLNLSENANAHLQGDNKITTNADSSGWRGGICMCHGCQVTVARAATATAKDEISGNNGPGIFVANTSELFLQQGTVSGNSMDGVRLRYDSCAQFDTGASIINNTGFGINCGDLANDSKYSGTPGDLSGNTLGGTHAVPY
jgi:hypothetical protein